MAYLALYREWRPQTFQEIVGQEHVTRTLQNALAFGRVGHAYLFCGPRGTGKTTAAKVLAKALNCRERQSAEPCNACASCREITAGNSLDVIEIDAASHRGIDEIRDLRDNVRFAPTAGDYRVYIIDEVHMLTNEAFNALLKTLEEPPAHVVFVLATTEPHKVPLTILSRCQRFDFHRIGIPHLLARLREVCAGADLAVDDDALYLIARAAEGGLRDALSILDQVAAFGEKRVTAEDIHQILGTVRAEVLDAAVAALDAGDAAGALKLLRSLVEQGKDLRLFVRELLTHLRSLLFLLVTPEADAEEELGPHEKERLRAQAKALGREKLLRFLIELVRTEQEIRWSAQPGILLEVALVRAILDGEAEPGAAGRDAGEHAAAERGAAERRAAERGTGERGTAGGGVEERGPGGQRAAERGPQDGLARRVARLEELVERLAGIQEAAAGPDPGAVGAVEAAPAGPGKGEVEKAEKEKTVKAARESEKSGEQKGARDRRGEVVRQAGEEAFRQEEKAPREGRALQEGREKTRQTVPPGNEGAAGEAKKVAGPEEIALAGKVAGAGQAAGSKRPGGAPAVEKVAAGTAGTTDVKKAGGGREGGGGREEQAFRELTARWGGFLEQLKKEDPPLYSFLAYGWPQELFDGSLKIAFEKEHELHKQYLESKLKEITSALNSFFLQKWQVRLVSGERPPEVDFPLRNKELKTSEALSLFGVFEEE